MFLSFIVEVKSEEAVYQVMENFDQTVELSANLSLSGTDDEELLAKFVDLI